MSSKRGKRHEAGDDTEQQPGVGDVNPTAQPPAEQGGQGQGGQPQYPPGAAPAGDMHPVAGVPPGLQGRPGQGGGPPGARPPGQAKADLDLLAFADWDEFRAVWQEYVTLAGAEKTPPVMSPQATAAITGGPSGKAGRGEGQGQRRAAVEEALAGTPYEDAQHFKALADGVQTRKGREWLEQARINAGVDEPPPEAAQLPVIPPEGGETPPEEPPPAETGSGA